jgi:hypothetical protein
LEDAPKVSCLDFSAKVARAFALPNEIIKECGAMAMTVKDLLRSAEFKRIFGRHAETYQRKFTAIASRSDALTLDISDPTVLGALMKPSWNWAAFFATTFWAIYWRLPIGWLFAGFSLVLIGIESAFATAGFVPSLQFFAFGFSLFFGLYANSFLLRNLIRRARDARLEEFSPSYSIAFAVLLVGITVPVVLAIGDLGSSDNVFSLLK